MKTLLIANTLFLLFFTLNLNSQTTTFEYLLSTPLDELFWDIVETPDDSIYLCGSLSTTAHPNKKYGLVAKLDRYGYLVDSNIISYPGKSLHLANIIPSSDQEYVLVTSIFDTIGTYKNASLVLYKMDNDMNLYYQKIFHFPPTYRFDHLIANMASSSNIAVAVSVRLPTQSSRSFFYEFNSDFDSLRAIYYPEGPRVISHIHELPENNYWTINMLLNQYELLDSSLNIIETQKVPNSITSNYGLAWDTDTSFYLLGDGMDFNLNPHNLAFIRQYHPMDTSNHLYNYWRDTDTVDFPATWNGIDFKNKDSIFIGGTRNIWLGYYNPWPSWFVVLQTDSLLNIRWERFYGGDAYYLMGKLIATNDGGCLVAGTRYDYLNVTEQETDIIILKLNSEGLLTGNGDKPAIEMHEAIVYPNPGNEVINVRIATQYKHSVFELFDINGRHVLKQNFTGTQGIVNTTFLDHGTYIYRITSNDGLFESGKWVKQ
ncbi:MAG: T9SS type A sorting domain-containing protein [Bacteroidetes bacterium]|nr:T9SS type A sorting domain-containing protein [Bacteroidota bacterium]MBL6943202.1 T9SS type A sorting domain-containing protein [Bacteroidales bacterium]